MIRRRVVVLASVMACGEPARVSTPATLPPSPQPKPPDMCAIIERVQRDALAEPTSCAPPRSRKFVSRCVRAGGGAWGLVVEHTDWRGRDFDCGALIEGAEFGVVSPRFMAHALYVDELGHAAIGPSFAWSTLEEVSTFDYDGDGVDELLVSGTRTNEDGSSEHVPFETPIGALWHARDGAVTAYAPAIAIRSFSDVDGDGRPDLITTRDFHLDAYDGDVTVYTFEGPEWVAHARTSGAFSFDDEVATSYVKRSCAGASLRTADALTLFRAAVCSSLDGVPAKAVERDYVARCATFIRPQQTPSEANAACRVDASGTLSEKIAVPAELKKLLER